MLEVKQLQFQPKNPAFQMQYYTWYTRKKNSATLDQKLLFYNDYFYIFKLCNTIHVLKLFYAILRFA